MDAILEVLGQITFFCLEILKSVGEIGTILSEALFPVV